ncbi:Phosphoribosylformylglycinamidine synthase subunit PurQ [Phycisphaerales bacterium]|nr:Phosphoribosylformylglycinamidine synthase subunit PurQ [Phycisphaerales bacterium]
MPRALVVRTAGTNCDAEMCRAFSLAGAEVELVHLDRLIREPARIDHFELFGFPGGFSYGDDIASGRIFAMKVRAGLYPALREALERGAAMIGACNGFQVLVQVGLLPGPAAGRPWPRDVPPGQTLALTDNHDARFHDRWVGVTYEVQSACIWTRGLMDGIEPQMERDASLLPVAHGEGRLVATDPGVISALEQGGQVVLRYRDNFNGSTGAIAGVCDASGRVFGLMPHPERYLDWTRHPYWTRLDANLRTQPTPGLRVFKNAVEAVSKVAV